MMLNKFKIRIVTMLVIGSLSMQTVTVFAQTNDTQVEKNTITNQVTESQENEQKVVPKYGLMIKKNTTYTWYDLNDSSEASHLVVSENNQILLPAWKVASFIPEVSYSYQKTTKKFTLSNKVNGRKITGTLGSKKITYYSSSKAKGITKTLKEKVALNESGTLVVPVEAFSYVMNPKAGYQFYETQDMKGRGYDCLTYQGIIVLSPQSPITSLSKATTVKELPNTIKVTIPEGYSLPQVFELLVNKGVCESVEELVKMSQEYPFDLERYSLLRELEDNENRCFRLEGFLYPDTYEFYRLSKPQDAIGRFLRNGEGKITKEYKDRAKELGFTMEQILTIASMIEKETGIKKEMNHVSAVLHNRLQQGMRLQLDASQFYLDRYIKPYRTDYVKLKPFYDTYRCKALPAGPICNPSMNAIKAALYPSEMNALFFCTDKEGMYYYSKTYEEHLVVLSEIKKREETEKHEETSGADTEIEIP